MLELMLSVILLTVFLSAFLASLDLVSKLMQGTEGGSPSSEIALSRTITQQRLHLLANELSTIQDIKPFLGNSNCLGGSTNNTWSLPSNKLGVFPPIWAIDNKQLVKFNLNDPPSLEKGGFERVCLYSTTFVENQALFTAGIYLLQAEPLQAGPLLQPLRVLLCRPKHFCL